MLFDSSSSDRSRMLVRNARLGSWYSASKYKSAEALATSNQSTASYKPHVQKEKAKLRCTYCRWSGS
jgi:hypothetical protein